MRTEQSKREWYIYNIGMSEIVDAAIIVLYIKKYISNIIDGEIRTAQIWFNLDEKLGS